LIHVEGEAVAHAREQRQNAMAERRHVNVASCERSSVDDVIAAIDIERLANPLVHGGFYKALVI